MQTARRCSGVAVSVRFLCADVPVEEYLPYYSDEVDAPQGTTFVKHFSVQDGFLAALGLLDVHNKMQHA